MTYLPFIRKGLDRVLDVFVIVAFVALFVLLAGILMDMTPAILIFTPIFLPD